MNNKTFKYDFLNLWLTGRMNDCLETNEYGDFSIHIDGEQIYLDKDDLNSYHDMFENLTEEQKRIGMSFWEERRMFFL